MDVREIRLMNLQRLLAEHRGRRVSLAKMLGKAPSQVSQWLHGQRTINENSARAIEDAAGKARGWLDEPPAAGTYAVLVANEPDTVGDKYSVAAAVQRLGQSMRTLPQSRRSELFAALEQWCQSGALRWEKIVIDILTDRHG